MDGFFIFECLHLWEGSTIPRHITHIWNLAHLFIPMQSKHQGNRMPCQSQLEHPHPPSPTNTKPEDSRSQCPNCWKKVCSLKVSGRKGGDVVFLRPGHKDQGYNLTESTDFMPSGAFTGTKWDMHILSCSPHDTISIKLLVHCLHNKLPDPCFSPLPLNCEMTCVISVKNESY